MAGLDKIDEDKLRSAFGEADKDKDGSIGIAGFSGVLRNLGENVKEDTLRDLLERSGIDYGKDDEAGISYGMFLTLTRRLAKETKQEAMLKKVFHEFDIDSKGHIDGDNIKRVLAKFDIEHIEGEVELMMEAADTNGDGKVDFEEFMQIFSRPPTQF